jgi:hypothetical protein
MAAELTVRGCVMHGMPVAPKKSARSERGAGDDGVRAGYHLACG